MGYTYYSCDLQPNDTLFSPLIPETRVLRFRLFCTPVLSTVPILICFLSTIHVLFCTDNGSTVYSQIEIQIQIHHLIWPTHDEMKMRMRMKMKMRMK